MLQRVSPSRILFLAAAQLAATACAEASGPAGERQTAAAPQPAVAAAQERRAGMATLPSGRGFLLELAITPEEQARGYMFRDEIRPDEGMLFLGSRPAIRRFHMKNCRVPIDMIWLDQDYRVVGIEHAAPYYKVRHRQAPRLTP